MSVDVLPCVFKIHLSTFVPVGQLWPMLSWHVSVGKDVQSLIYLEEMHDVYTGVCWCEKFEFLSASFVLAAQL